MSLRLFFCGSCARCDCTPSWLGTPSLHQPRVFSQHHHCFSRPRLDARVQHYTNIRSSTASGSLDAKGVSAVSSSGVSFLCISTSRASGTASRCVAPLGMHLRCLLVFARLERASSSACRVGTRFIMHHARSIVLGGTRGAGLGPCFIYGVGSCGSWIEIFPCSISKCWDGFSDLRGGGSRERTSV